LEKLISIGWSDLLIPKHSVAEMVLRGTVMNLALFLIFRFIMLGRRSTIGIAALVIVVIADAAQDGFVAKQSLGYRC
jgi:hypothetical protein